MLIIAHRCVAAGSSPEASVSMSSKSSGKVLPPPRSECTRSTRAPRIDLSLRDVTGRLRPSGANLARSGDPFRVTRRSDGPVQALDERQRFASRDPECNPAYTDIEVATGVIVERHAA